MNKYYKFWREMDSKFLAITRYLSKTQGNYGEFERAFKLTCYCRSRAFRAMGIEVDSKKYRVIQVRPLTIGIDLLTVNIKPE
jgi:hypothetical protein